MRDINWDEPLSNEDKEWLRQSGMPMVEERIAENEKRFGEEVSTPEAGQDPTTKSALDPTATASEGPVATANTPAQPVDEEETEYDDDYDEWTKAELEAEVTKRNDEASTEADEVKVTGTGRNGAVKVADLVSALRAWDRKHPTD